MLGLMSLMPWPTLFIYNLVFTYSDDDQVVQKKGLSYNVCLIAPLLTRKGAEGS